MCGLRQFIQCGAETQKGGTWDIPGRHSEPLSLVNGGNLLVTGHQPRANLVNRPFQGEQFRPTLTLFAPTTYNMGVQCG